MPTDDQYLSIRDICAELRLSHETVRKWIITGQLPHIKAGRQYRVRRSDLERMLANGPPLLAGGEASGESSPPNPMSPGAGLDARFTR